MPIYVYQCLGCQHCFELKQSFSAEPQSACPVCGAPARRVFQAVSLVFKGSGWYTTDSRSRQGEDAASGETKAPAEGHPAPKAEPAAEVDAGSKNRAKEA